MTSAVTMNMFPIPENLLQQMVQIVSTTATVTPDAQFKLLLTYPSL